MTGTLGRGLAAGAVGTTALNAVTYLDMLWRGRDASDVPADAVGDLLGSVGVEVPGSGPVLRNRSTALGSLTGIGAGLAVGVGASVARSRGLRAGPVAGSVLTGLTASLSSDVPATLLGATDPRSWTTADWLADAVPHLAYGIATHATLDALARPGDEPPAVRARPALVLRCAALGAAAGSRTSLGVAGPALTARRPRRALAVLSVLGLGGELAVDKHPATPSRLEPGPRGGRLAAGTAGAVALARREHARPLVPALAGAAGAAAGTWAGAAWRAARPGTGAAVAEDAVALALAALACLPGRRRRLS